MTIDAPNWNLIRKLASAASAAYHAATVNDPHTGTQANIFVDGVDIVVAFRGSSEPKDFILDARFLKSDLMYSRDGGEAEVHAGFIAAFDSVNEEVIKQVKNLLVLMPAAAIHITGHSLGGALAQLCALEFVRQHLPVRAVVTFGSPRVGNKTFAALYNDSVTTSTEEIDGVEYFHSLKEITFNVVNEGDPVPLLPPLLNGYRDAGTEFFLRRSGEVQVDPFIGFEIFTDVMGAISSWRNYRLGLLPNHFIAAYQERISKK
jgi:hypothetical protein